MRRSLLVPVWIICITMTLFPVCAVAQMQSSNYQIPWDSVNSGGGEQGGSSNYQIVDSLGQSFAGGPSASTNYQAIEGYRAGDKRALSFEISTTETPLVPAMYTAISVAGKTVTGANAAVLASFSVGDLIALVESPGASQVTAVGKVIAKSGSVMTLDRLDGQTGTLGSAVSGYIYKLGGSSFSFGEVSPSAVSVGTLAISAVSDVGSGYTVYAQASGQPTNGSHSLTAVSDGAVTAGSEEYGLHAYGSTAATLLDTAVTSTEVAIQSTTGQSANPADRIAVVYKLAVSSSTPSGTYAQTVFFTMTPNY